MSGNAGRAALLGLWGDGGAQRAVHMAIMSADAGNIAVLSLACPAGTFPSVGGVHPPAIRLERLSVSAKWNAEQAGRGEATISGGDTPGRGTVTASQCWDDGGTTTFVRAALAGLALPAELLSHTAMLQLPGPGTVTVAGPDAGAVAGVLHGPAPVAGHTW